MHPSERTLLASSIGEDVPHTYESTWHVTYRHIIPVFPEERLISTNLPPRLYSGQVPEKGGKPPKGGKLRATVQE